MIRVLAASPAGPKFLPLSTTTSPPSVFQHCDGGSVCVSYCNPYWTIALSTSYWHRVCSIIRIISGSKYCVALVDIGVTDSIGVCQCGHSFESGSWSTKQRVFGKITALIGSSKSSIVTIHFNSAPTPATVVHVICDHATVILQFQAL